MDLEELVIKELRCTGPLDGVLHKAFGHNVPHGLHRQLPSHRFQIHQSDQQGHPLCGAPTCLPVQRETFSH